MLTLAYNVILARLLSPREFGLYAMVMTVAAFMNIFKDAGLSTVTIQKESITHAQVSNLFWMNVAVSGLAAATMALAAPAVAWFYRQPELVAISLVLAGGFLLEGLAIQHIALLNRQMRFAAVSAIEIGATTGGLLLGVGMAVAGRGYWSLVAATLSTSAFRMLAAWAVSPWRPTRPTANAGTRPLIHFGANLTVSGVLYTFARGADGVLIGRFLGTEALGLYARASALLTKPMERLLSPIYQVIVPALSRLQSDPDRYRKTYLQVFQATAIAGFVFAGVCAPVARPLVIVILGPKWEAAAPVFGAMSLAALFVPLSAAASWLYMSQGRGRALLLTCGITAITMTSAFAVGLHWGPAGVALAYSIWGIALDLPVTFAIAGRRGPVTAKDLWLASTRHSPMFVAAFVVASLVASAGALSTPLHQVIWAVAAGSLAATVVLFVSPWSRQTRTELIRLVATARLIPLFHRHRVESELSVDVLHDPMTSERPGA